MNYEKTDVLFRKGVPCHLRKEIVNQLGIGRSKTVVFLALIERIWKKFKDGKKSLYI